MALVLEDVQPPLRIPEGAAATGVLAARKAAPEDVPFLAAPLIGDQSPPRQSRPGGRGRHDADRPAGPGAAVPDDADRLHGGRASAGPGGRLPLTHAQAKHTRLPSILDSASLGTGTGTEEFIFGPTGPGSPEWRFVLRRPAVVRSNPLPRRTSDAQRDLFDERLA